MFELVIDSGLFITVDRERAKQLHAQLTDHLGLQNQPPGKTQTTPDGTWLKPDAAAWDHTSGGRGHHRAPWTESDLDAARTLRRSLSDKASALFEMWLESPGRVFDVNDLIDAHPDKFANAYAIAGALRSIGIHAAKADRSIPFDWWDGSPARYAIHPDTAAVFLKAGR